MKKLLALFALLFIVGQLAAQEIPANMTLYQCSLTKGVYTSQQVCMQYCMSLPNECQVFQQPTASKPLDLLLGICLSGLIVLAVVAFVFKDELAKLINPEDDRERILDPPVFLEETGWFYNRAKWLRREIIGGKPYLKEVLTDTTRRSDVRTISEKTHFLRLPGMFKRDAQMKVARFDVELREALERASIAETQYGTMLERHRHFVGTDMLGTAKEMAVTFGEIVTKIRPQVYPAQQTHGGGVKFAVPMQDGGGD